MTPADHRITIVCGFGRCGTSMVMQMLVAAGMPPSGGQWPAFEDDRLLSQRIGENMPILPLLTALQPPVALKILDPQLFAWPPVAQVRFIWIDRDPRQQALSQLKFISMIQGLEFGGRAGVRAMAASLRRDRPRARARIRRLGPLLTLQFEEILIRPAATAARIMDFIPGLTARADMARVVRTDRPAGCYPGLLEVELLEQQRA